MLSELKVSGGVDSCRSLTEAARVYEEKGVKLYPGHAGTMADG